MLLYDDMQQTTLEDVLKALESDDQGIQIPPELAEKATQAVIRMTEIDK